MFADRTLFGLGGQSRRDNPIYLLPNGLTKVAADWAKTNTYYTLSLDEGLPEETYYVFGDHENYHEKSLRSALENTYDPESDTLLPYGGNKRVKLCNVITTFVTDFYRTFNNVPNTEHITADIASWDMRRATDIGLMFGSAKVIDSVIEYWDPKSVWRYNNTFAWLQHDIDLSRWNFAVEFDRGEWVDNRTFPSDKNLPTGGTVKERTFDKLHLVMENGTEHILTETDSSLGVTVSKDVLRVNNSSVVEVKDWPTFFRDKGASFDVSRIYLEGSTQVKKIPHYLPLGITDTTSMFNNLRELDADFRYFLTHRVTSMHRMFNYTASISGRITGFKDWNTSKLTNMREMFSNSSIGEEDLNWDTSNVQHVAYAFRGCNSFNGDISSFRLPKVTDFSYMFTHCNVFNKPLKNLDVSSGKDFYSMFSNCMEFDQDINTWDMSNARNLSYMFSGCSKFNSPLDSWDVGSATDLSATFIDCVSFDQRIGNWDTSNVTRFMDTFKGCKEFNQDIANWVTHKATNMAGMFSGCVKFNKDISGWETSKVTHFGTMFVNCKEFNQPIGKWDMSSATFLNAMLDGCSKFDQDLSEWNTKNFEQISSMFRDCLQFNSPIGMWKTEKVTEMRAMFKGCVSFNQDISSWVTSSVRTMQSMFEGCTKFNHPIGGWDVSEVTDMLFMFRDCVSFNQDVTSWVTKNVTNMNFMFYNCTSFDQDLSQWCVPNITELPSYFDVGATSWTLPRPVWGTCPNG